MTKCIIWYHNYYTTECSAGNYGVNCNSTCGQCSNGKLCHHITGKCEKGCLPGYKEPTCEMGTVCKKYLKG